MDGLALVVVAAIMFVAGMLLGRHLAARKAAARPPAVQVPDRLQLAQAWQRGFDEATRDAANQQASDGHPASPAGQERAPHGASPGSQAAAMQSRPVWQPQVPAGPGAGGTVGQEPRTMPWQAPHAVQVPPSMPAIPVDPRARALRNINITLYVAALLLVAAASLFIALALPAAAKVVGLGIVAAGFYAAGLLMHAKSQRLRPAAAAFTATGLALIPMTGLAHYLLLSSTPGASWFVTSVVGTAAFIYAGGKLQSRIVAGLATTFLVSTAYSGGAVLNRGLVFYFLFSMLLAAAITLLGFRKPRWISNIYLASFTVAHRYLVPATLLAAILSMSVLGARDYAWLFAAAALYYAVALVAAPASERFWHQGAARAAGMVSLGCFLYVAEVPLTGIFRILAALLLLQLVLLAQLARPYARKLELTSGFAQVETWALLGLAAICTMLGAEGLLHDAGTGADAEGLDLNWALALFLAAGAFLGAKLGGRFAWVPLGVGLLGVVEPMAGNPGRQGILLAVAALATWALTRRTRGRQQLFLRWGARIASVVATGALFSFAAAGWVLEPRFAAVHPGSPAAGSANAAALGRAIEVATFVGLILALLVQLGIATRNLRRADPGAHRSPEGRLLRTGESWFFAGAVLCAAVSTWSLSVLLGSGNSRASAQWATEHGWGTALWLGYSWDVILLWGVVLAGLHGATGILGHRRRTAAATREAGGSPGEHTPAVVVHLAGLLALGTGLGIASGKDPAWMVELLAVLGLAYVGVRIRAAGFLAARIGYAVLAQVLFSGTAWHLADRFSMDNHGQYALLAFTIGLGQAVRAYTGRNAGARKLADPRTLLSLAAVAVLVLIPLAYLVSHAGNLDQAGLLVQFLCLTLFSALLVKTRARVDEGFAYVAIPAALGLLGLVLAPSIGAGLRSGGWLPTPLWDRDVAFGVLALLLIGLLVAERRNTGGPDFGWVRAGVGLLYWTALLGLHGATEPGWQAMAGLLGAAGVMVFAATWGIPLLLLGSAAGVLLASLRATALIHELAGARGSEPLDSMLGLGATWALLLAASVLGGRFGAAEVPFSAVAQRTKGWGPAHARVLFTTSLAALGLGGLLGLGAGTDRYVYAGAVMLLAAVLSAAALEVPARRRETGFEIAALVGAAVIQRCWWVAVDGMGAFGTLYYWVMVLGALAVFEFLRKRERNGIVGLGAAVGLLSLTGLGTFVSSTLAQQLVVLLSFTALLVFGLMTNRRIFTVWGAVGIALAVLWFLRGFTFLLLLLIAVGLIALALWRLGKMNKGTGDTGAPGAGHPSAPPMPPAGHHPHAGYPSVSGEPFPAAGETREPGATEPGTTETGQSQLGAVAPPSPRPPAGLPWMRPQDPGDGPR